jgi:hypothetical protein
MKKVTDKVAGAFGYKSACQILTILLFIRQLKARADF